MKPSIMQGSNVWFNSTLPFRVKEDQIIYVENEYNQKINQFIEKNYEKIKLLLLDEGLDFAYIPVIQRNLIDKCTYMIPDYPSKIISGSIARLKDIPPQTIYNSIFSHLKEEKSLNPGLIHYQKTENNVHIFSYFEIQFITDYEFWNEIKWYIENIQIWDLRRAPYIRQVISPAMHDWTIVDKREDNFQEKYSDISEFILQTFFIAELQKPSKLIITKDLRIVLTDYDKMEIHLTPLAKALYFLFLKHQEGIFFKNLFDYKDELKNIYIKLSNRDNFDTIEQSLKKITNSTMNNTVNENCSRIREAFINKLGGRLAENYCITGGRLTPQRITLDRKLVRIEANI